MSNTKHTPGPWQFAMGGVTKDWPQVESPTGALIARTYDVNAEDNARLIAAAPAMLDLLCIARDELAQLNQHENDNGVLLDAIDAAIAQATGEQS
jgi:hypothetical protein